MSITKQASTDLKIKAIKYYYKINNYSKVCKIFECSERSLKRWVERYEQNKSLERKQRKLGSYKIKKEHYENYFTYAYNKDSYKGKKGSKKSSKHRKLKIYKD